MTIAVDLGHKATKQTKTFFMRRVKTGCVPRIVTHSHIVVAAQLLYASLLTNAYKPFKYQPRLSLTKQEKMALDLHVLATPKQAPN